MLGFLDAAARRALRRFGRRATEDPRYVVLALAALLAHVALKPEKPLVTRTDLRLGESVLVRHLPPPPTRRAKRRARRAEDRARRAAARVAPPPPVEIPPHLLGDA